MYIVDITRGEEYTNNDMLVGKNSMDAKRKTINYIYNYVLANLNVSIDKDLIDKNIIYDMFSLKRFMLENYNITIKNELTLHILPAEKENCLFVKYYDKEKLGAPFLITLSKDDYKKAMSLLTYFVNDSLIYKYKDNLEEYEKRKLNGESISYSSSTINCEIISLYENGKFLEELLENDYSLNQMYKEFSRRINYDI